ncbi:MAG TPA: citrate (Si)-synthase, partial [Anaerolineales bacterium]|nr:citrate (Si)-synthase [Anaerolineales bacterium]
MKLDERLASQLPQWRERVTKLVKESGDVKIDDVNIAQVYGGMRDVKGLVTDISYVDPEEGIRLRGFTISELLEKLPKPAGVEMPYSGGLYYLLLIGDLPTEEDALEVELEWKARGQVPQYVYDLIQSMPGDTHPMTLFSLAVLSMQRESIFARRYQEGIKREDYWQSTLQDSLNLTAKLPAIAAFIYSHKYKDGQVPKADAELDWAANVAYMLGIQDEEYKDLCRLYFLLHSDHESGNASAHATHLTGSTLSDVYYATSSGLNALAGPLHGLANQESLEWLLQVYQKYGRLPTKEELHKFAWDTLENGQVIPGYGHGVLRKTDPRFTAQIEFGQRRFPQDEIFQLANMVYEIVPQVLMEQGKAKNPWPNVDAISGALQHHYGVRQFDFYTVMFGVSR